MVACIWRLLFISFWMRVRSSAQEVSQELPKGDFLIKDIRIDATKDVTTRVYIPLLYSSTKMEMDFHMINLNKSKGSELRIFTADIQSPSQWNQNILASYTVQRYEGCIERRECIEVSEIQKDKKIEDFQHVLEWRTARRCASPTVHTSLMYQTKILGGCSFELNSDGSEKGSKFFEISLSNRDGKRQLIFIPCTSKTLCDISKHKILLHDVETLAYSKDVGLFKFHVVLYEIETTLTRVFDIDIHRKIYLRGLFYDISLPPNTISYLVEKSRRDSPLPIHTKG